MATDQVFAKATTWRQGKPLYVKVAGTWQRVKTVWVKVTGTWTQVFGEAVSLTASGTVIGANSWTFNYGVFAETGDTIPGGGLGAVVRLQTEPGAIIYADYSDVGGAGNTAPVDVDETASYKAILFDKAGAEVDSVIFTPV